MLVLGLLSVIVAVQAAWIDASPAPSSKPLAVTAVIAPPYVWECSGQPLPENCISASFDGNTTHVKGFLVDLLKKLAEKGNFRYEVHLRKDGRYGYKDPNSASGWTGMIGELIKNEADLALAPFTVTDERTEVVSFTTPFSEQIGLSVLLKKPISTQSSTCVFCTKEKMMIPFSNEDDLSMQAAIKYGVLAGGSVYRFFQNSQVDPYKKMWSFMSAHPEKSFVNNTKDGIDRVRTSQGRFAFIMEKPAVHFVSSQIPCDTVAIDFDRKDYNTKGYSLALPVGSAWTETLSRLIDELQTNGSIVAMYDQWWKSTECV
ncbi:glutamate receptor-like [Paramacrobiotus metropolitanus]|uniref:glutamate receptor-like n=1 Tax=Paramacrobiotus metropolitanus TaxID=2943436 RepID=UPI0024459333|nr:glutamate receptor-like [Paramacrobiotus metropolitanus]